MSMGNGMLNGQGNQKINPQQMLQQVFQHMQMNGMLGGIANAVGGTGMQPGGISYQPPGVGQGPPQTAAWNPQTAAAGINNAVQQQFPSLNPGPGNPVAQQPPALTGRGMPVQVHPNIAPFAGAPPAPGWNPSMVGPGTTASANPNQLAQPNALYQSLGVGPQPGQTIGDRMALWSANRAASGMYNGR